jgi:hypothetical protein
MKRSANCLLAASLLLNLAAGPAFCANEPTAQQAHELYKAGKYADAQRAYEAIISAKRNAEVKEQRQYAELLLGYGRSLAAIRKYDESLKMLLQALAIAEAFALPGDFTLVLKDEVDALKEKTNQGVPQGYYRYSSYNNSEQHDSAEREHLCKSAIEFAKERYGVGSMTYLLRQIDYARFLSEQHRRDDLAKQAAICREIFSKLAPDNQGQTAPQVLEFAQSLAQNNLPLDADTVGSIVMDSITSGGIKNAMELSNNLERLATTLDRDQSSELAQKYYAASVRTFEKQAPPDDPRLAKMRDALAAHYKKVGKNGAAIELLEMSVAAQAKNISTGSPEAVSALANLTELYCMTANLPKAKECSQKLAEAVSRMSDDSAVPFKAMFDAAQLLAGKGDLPEAQHLYKAALDATRRSRRNNYDYELQRQVKEFAVKIGALGHPEEAEKVYDAYIASRATSLGQPTSQTLSAYIDKATFFMEQEIYDKAATAAMSALELNGRFTTNQDSRLNELARQFVAHKQYEPALKLQLAWLDSSEATHGMSDSQINDGKLRLATIYHQMGQNAESVKMMKQIATKSNDKFAGKAASAIPILTQALDKLIAQDKLDAALELVQGLTQSASYAHPADALVRINYILTQQKLYDESEVLLTTALDAQNSIYGPSSLQSASILSELARVAGSRGDEAKSNQYQKSAEAIYTLQRKQVSANANGTDIYNPKAPLQDTIKAAGDLGETGSGIVLRRHVINVRQIDR